MLFIEPPILNKMIMGAESSTEECCGFFFGHENPEYRTISKSMAVMNALEGDKSGNFEITSKDYLYAEQVAVQNNLTLLGVYHSHPNHPALPSEYDRVAAQPYFSYVILSVMNQKFEAIRSWQLDAQSQFIEEKIDTLQSPT